MKGLISVDKDLKMDLLKYNSVYSEGNIIRWYYRQHPPPQCNGVEDMEIIYYKLTLPLI